MRMLRHWAGRPWFAYLTLLLLQLKLVWNIWQYRDISSADTSNYFMMAYRWFKDFRVNIAWSPLYTAFYGQLLHLATDAYAVTTLHRLMIVFTLALLVLALMRRLLPPEIAWLAAAWWVVLPVNFDAVFEVHLFAVIPVLLAFLLILSSPRPWARGAALAMLGASAVLVRNELMVAAGLLALFCLLWEARLRRIAKAEQRAPPGLREYLAGYGGPFLLAVLVVLFFYSRSVIQFPELSAASAPKHTLNMCQVYAFGYKQRHPEWQHSPWTECYDLMQADFGARLVALPEMIRRNPRAVWEHFGWNIGLAPSGLQVLLFNSASGAVNPDYVAVQLNSPIANVLSIIVIAIIAAGLVLLYRDRQRWWAEWLHSRALGWLAMLAVAAVALVVIPTQRPRPSYLFTLGIFVMALTGMCAFAIVRRWPAFERLSRWMPLAMLALIAAVPSYYTLERIPQRRLRDIYERLKPSEALLAKPKTVILLSLFAVDMPNYVVHDERKVPAYIYDYQILFARPADMPLTAFLDQHGINLLYVDDSLWTSLDKQRSDRQFLSSPDSFGWQRVAMQTNGDRWMLLQRKPPLSEDPAALRRRNANPDIGPPVDTQALYAGDDLPADGLFVGQDWHQLEKTAEGAFRWVDNNAQIVVTSPTGRRTRLHMIVEPGPGLAGQPFELQVLDQAGRVVARANVQGRQPISVALPIVAGEPGIFRLHVEGGGLPAGRDPRTLNFRVFKFAWDS
jgi:hypothetical protein